MAETKAAPRMSRSSEAEKVVAVEIIWYNDWIKEHAKPSGSFSEKVAIVTGSNSGTGFWCARALAGTGTTVILACRNTEKATLAKEEIEDDFPKAKLDVMKLDTSSLQSVRDFAEAFTSKYSRLDYLVNNAGVMALPYSKTEDGFEIQWQTNHLGHFLLTKLLWDTMLNTPGQSRIVQHSSSAHALGSPKFDKDNMEKPKHSVLSWPLWNMIIPMMGMPKFNWLRYGVSKVSNVLFMKGIEKRINEKGLQDQVVSMACHPGYAKTQLQVVASDAGGMNMKTFASMDGQAQSAADGSLPLLMACLSNEVASGDYFGPESGTKGLPKKEKIGGYGNDPTQANDLWEFSEECIGENFDI